MRRPALYSSPRRPADASPQAPAAAMAPANSPDAPPPAAASAASVASTDTPPRNASRTSRRARLWRVVRIATTPALAAAALAVAVVVALRPVVPPITQKDVDAAVRHTLEKAVLPSAVARAADKVAPSVVRVVAYDKSEKIGRGKYKPKEEGEIERGIGTGVVIVDKGVILTNLHVVAGADHIRVTFSDGLESVASVINVQQENDLAVLQAHKIPDDLAAATLKSTASLRPGDEVAAIGFPFGIGPSVSSGIVSGLKRGFLSPEGKQQLSNLIQFDAAANPGNSGGPLLTMDGEVVGIVTAILNPTQHRTFLGIGFAVPIENAAAAAGMPPF
ncbi:S1C family serine protease [Xylophilus sp. GOD-11R]|uniref:S1C family serine protease n=1 Tax=Xylophilus sp. GOD-11R TaxID=3089814 RepID=UPI00298C641D|nr:trypsin-like peptidase domain-containing protein [Xylophilus sp. GOD-11R]WPB56050.1 trypsin-like peptidase domain-containing protein [Xylophilus sp. GOD-11R]